MLAPRGEWGDVSAPSRPNIRSGIGPGVGGLGQGGPPASDIIMIGVVGGLGGEMVACVLAVGMGVTTGAMRGEAIIVEAVG